MICDWRHSSVGRPTTHGSRCFEGYFGLKYESYDPGYSLMKKSRWVKSFLSWEVGENLKLLGWENPMLDAEKVEMSCLISYEHLAWSDMQ